MNLNSKFPCLVDLAKSALVSANPAHALTREQRDHQENLRREFPSHAESGGVVLPWLGREARAGSSVSTANAGGYAVGVDVADYGPSLRDKLALNLLGARVYGGLKSDFTFPQYSAGISASWLSETAQASEGTNNFTGLSLAPKRITATITVSRQLVAQGQAVEGFLGDELMAALSEEIARVAINGLPGNGEPMGILGYPNVGVVAGGANGAAPDITALASLEFTVADAKGNQGHLGFLTSPKVRRKLRQTFVNGNGSDPLWSLDRADSLLGHPAAVTKLSPDNLSKGTSIGVCSAIVFGEWSELVIGIWGAGFDVLVDAFSLAQSGKVQITAVCFVDLGVRHASAFAVMSDALAA